MTEAIKERIMAALRSLYNKITPQKLSAIGSSIHEELYQKPAHHLQEKQYRKMVEDDLREIATQ